MEKLNNATFLESFSSEFPSYVLHIEESYGMLTIEIPQEKNVEILTYLYQHPQWKINFLTDICAVHYPEQEGKELAVVYHLQSMVNNFRVRLKCFIPISNPQIASLTSLYRTANWMERETFDFYGVQFTGHPNLKRILNVDEMDYFPLRKEYALEDETRDDKDDRYFGR